VHKEIPSANALKLIK